MKDTKGKKGAVASSAGNDKDLKRKKQLSVKDDKARKRQLKKERKAKKDPNQPKRPPTAFFVFLEEFRKSYKDKNPNVKGVAVVGKAGGDKWKEMSDAEKAPYVRKAAQKKADYDKAMASYKQKKVDADEEGSAEESEKSKSEINDDDESEEEEDDDDE